MWEAVLFPTSPQPFLRLFRFSLAAASPEEVNEADCFHVAVLQEGLGGQARVRVSLCEVLP